jgi:HD-GYP domain-containing protein (c-di-GMP phosphodiesterase class II)
MELARMVPNPNRPQDSLLQAGFQLTSKVINRLQGMGVTDVWIRHDGLAFLDDMIDDATEMGYREVYATVRKQFETLQNRHVAQLDYMEYHEQVRLLFDSLMNNPAVMKCCTAMLRQGDYLFTHASNVSYLCLLMGMKLEKYMIEQREVMDWKMARDVTHLGIGALLHDVGVLGIDRSIVEKDGNRTEDEEAQFREHTTLGFEKVREAFRPPQANIVLNHHQRYDGSGYPSLKDPLTGEMKPPQSGDSIHIFSRICAICDVYDSATNSRPWKPGKMPIEILSEIKYDCADWFDPVVREAFLEIVPACPPGSQVELSDGRRGAVLEHVPSAPCRPVIKVFYDTDGTELFGDEQPTVKLADEENAHLHIKTLLGRNVEELLFE